MNNRLLQEYIKLVLEDESIRTPTQLLSPDDNDTDPKDKNGSRYRDNWSRENNTDKENNNEVEEFCAAGGGAIAGMTLPLGMSPNSKNKKN